MSTIFERTPADIAAFLKREALRREMEGNEHAINALQRGIAFADGPGDDEGDAEEMTFLDDPAHDEAIRNFVQADGE